LSRDTADVSVLLTLILMVIAWPNVPAAIQRGQQNVQSDELVTIWLDSIDRVALDAYRPIAFDALPAIVRGDSSLWCERLFTSTANPHTRKMDVKWSYHLATEDTPDILRAEYVIPPYAVEMLETRGYVVARVRKADVPDRGFVLAVAEAMLLKPPGTAVWNFQFPAALSEGSRFTTNSALGPHLIASWEDRTDGGVRKGALFFLRFKKSLERIGYPDLRRWFDDAFRSKS
jgi:hypothetical protein